VHILHIQPLLEKPLKIAMTLESCIHKGWSVIKATWHLKCNISRRHV